MLQSARLYLLWTLHPLSLSASPFLFRQVCGSALPRSPGSPVRCKRSLGSGLLLQPDSCAAKQYRGEGYSNRMAFGELFLYPFLLVAVLRKLLPFAFLFCSPSLLFSRSLSYHALQIRGLSFGISQLRYNPTTPLLRWPAVLMYSSRSLWCCV